MGRRLVGVLAGLAALVSLAACASGSGSAAPTWSPQPAYTLEPNPVQPGSGPTGGPAPTATGGAPAPSGSASSGAPVQDPAVVATGLTAPLGIAVLPDASALVGQRNGTIVQVQPIAGQPVTTVRTISGLDSSGDGGLLDLALSPAYSQDHLIYAYVTSATDNRVVDFTLTGPVTPVFTGIPKASTGNRGRIAFDGDGNLLIGTGDTGQPALAQNPASLAGKVLQVNDVGQPVKAGSAVFTRGHHNVAGLCVDAATNSVFETEPNAPASANSAATADEVNLLSQDSDYGWPTATASSVTPLAVLPTTAAGVFVGAGGCAVSDGVVYVASLAGTALYSADIVSSSGPVKLDPFLPTLVAAYGQLVTVVADPDGSLWLATANTGVSPAPGGASDKDERIVHIQPSGGGRSSQV